MDWIKRMNSVLDYIENNLDGEIKDSEIAGLFASSKGMFQRIFAIITDMTLAEYIRKRRLTQAALDIRNTNARLLDIAVKYGYNSADAFTSAFKNFHGITPSNARTPEARIQSFQRFIFTLTLSVKGGNDMQNYNNESPDVILQKINDVIIELGRAKISAWEIKELSEGNVIKLDTIPKNPLSLIINGNLMAKAEPGVRDDKFVFKITEVISGNSDGGNEDITYDGSDSVVNITVELVRTRKFMQDIKDFKSGDIVKTEKLSARVLDVFADGKLIAKGTAVVMDENFAVKITEIIAAKVI